MVRTDSTTPTPGRRMWDVGLWMVAILLAGGGLTLALRRPSPAADAILRTTSLPPKSERLPPGVWFQEVASTSGIDFHHESGAAEVMYMPESMAGGVCLLDYDRDGRLDVYYVQAGRVLGATHDTPGNRLYRQVADDRFQDVTADTGTGDTGYGMGCTCGDFNNDGWTDVYVTNAGPNVLFQNDGAGGFTDVTQRAGVGDDRFGASASFVDYDNDGDLDLYVVNYVQWSIETEILCTSSTGLPDYCAPKVYPGPAFDVLYRNNGDGTFTDVTSEVGVSAMSGNGLGITHGDFNGDGLVDLAIANDLVANQLWINTEGGHFYDQALQKGVAYSGEGMPESGMGIDAQDVDQDGDLDILMTHFNEQTNTLYLNDQGFFTDDTARLGLGVSRPFTGFGTAMVDLNNDGRLEIYVANGRVALDMGENYTDDPYAEPNLLLEQEPDGVFKEVTPRGGTAKLLAHSSRGAAFGDYDNDGDIDVFVINRDGPAYLLRNVVGDRRNFINFRVLNRHGSDALGARVTIEYAGERRMRDVKVAYSYCSSNDPRVHFGLGGAERVDKVVITWTEGASHTFGPFNARSFVELKPDGTHRLLP